MSSVLINLVESNNKEVVRKEFTILYSCLDCGVCALFQGGFKEGQNPSQNLIKSYIPDLTE